MVSEGIDTFLAFLRGTEQQYHKRNDNTRPLPCRIRGNYRMEGQT